MLSTLTAAVDMQTTRVEPHTHTHTRAQVQLGNWSTVSQYPDPDVARWVRRVSSWGDAA